MLIWAHNNVLCAPAESLWKLVTFDDPDFDPGFATDVPVTQRHVFQISVFADNAKTITRSLLSSRHGKDEIIY